MRRLACWPTLAQRRRPLVRRPWSVSRRVPMSARQHNNVQRFLGIPYARPPVGKLRWQPPRAPRKQAGRTLATTLGPACPQPNSNRATSEDCLSLNVWTPALDDAQRPVMVWVHGGGFRGGSNDIPGEVFADPAANASPAVVVSINYRLGPLGFFAHDALGK